MKSGERNMVSIEEALEVTDKKSLRTFMMNVIRGDYRKYLSSISLALNNEDTETAHYRSFDPSGCTWRIPRERTGEVSVKPDGG